MRSTLLVQDYIQLCLQGCRLQILSVYLFDYTYNEKVFLISSWNLSFQNQQINLMQQAEEKHLKQRAVKLWAEKSCCKIFWNTFLDI